MASCSLGAPRVILPNLTLRGTRVSNVQQQNGARIHIGAKQLQQAGVILSGKPQRTFSTCCGLALDIEPTAEEGERSTEPKSSGLTSPLIPSPFEIESLVTEICDTTSIAEFQLKLGGFELHVTRNIIGKSVPAPVDVPAPIPDRANPSGQALGSNGAVASTSLGISVVEPSSSGTQSVLDTVSDEGLAILESPEVGVFRTYRTIKGNRTPPLCREKQKVRKGEVLGCIERLGREIRVKSNVAGVIVRILRVDDEPVGYRDPLIAILPSVPGIKNPH